MKKYIYGIVLSVFMVGSFVTPIQSGTLEIKCNEMEMCGASRFSLKQAETYIKALMEKVDPKKILVVLDVDGTLTNYSDPSAHEGPAHPRGDSPEFVKELLAKGVKVVVSSAWDNLDETLRRLTDLGLHQILWNHEEKKCGEMTHLNKLMEYCKSGLVVSVGAPKDPYGYYRQKAFAYKFAYPDLTLDEITHVVFIDDSSGNISTFKQDIVLLKEDGLAKDKDVQVDMFLLSSAEGQPSLD